MTGFPFINVSHQRISVFKESLNNKPCILVKHAIQAFFSEYRAYAARFDAYSFSSTMDKYRMFRGNCQHTGLLSGYSFSSLEEHLSRYLKELS